MALLAGEAVEFTRESLPSWCAARWAGGNYDMLEITEDNMLVEVA